MHPTRQLLTEQLALGRQHMPRGMPMHEVWTQVASDPHAIRTFNDALYFIFVFLVACPGYTRYVCENSNKRTMDAFLVVLREKFTALMLGRAAGGKRAESPAAKEFQGAIDFTIAMRSRCLRM
jgi:hypothetical protein